MKRITVSLDHITTKNLKKLTGYRPTKTMSNRKVSSTVHIIRCMMKVVFNTELTNEKKVELYHV